MSILNLFGGSVADELAQTTVEDGGRLINASTTGSRGVYTTATESAICIPFGEISVTVCAGFAINLASPKYSTDLREASVNGKP